MLVSGGAATGSTGATGSMLLHIRWLIGWQWKQQWDPNPCQGKLQALWHWLPRGCHWTLHQWSHLCWCLRYTSIPIVYLWYLHCMLKLVINNMSTWPAFNYHVEYIALELLLIRIMLIFNLHNSVSSLDVTLTGTSLVVGTRF